MFKLSEISENVTMIGTGYNFFPNFQFCLKQLCCFPVWSVARETGKGAIKLYMESYITKYKWRCKQLDITFQRQ